jgi:hypothetical protein
MSLILEFDPKDMINKLIQKNGINNLLNIPSDYRYTILETITQYGLIDHTTHKCWFASTLADVMTNINIKYKSSKHSNLEYHITRNKTAMTISVEYIENDFNGSIDNPFYSNHYEWIIYGIRPTYQIALRRLFVQRYSEFQTTSSSSTPEGKFSDDEDDAGSE